VRVEQTLSLDASFLSALHSAKPVGGLTHGFYLYPARFPPEIARSVITRFSKPGECVLDPFMGGGTSIVEGLAHGRMMVGTDVNALSHFVASVRTTPLSPADESTLKAWTADVSEFIARDGSWVERPGIRNLPRSVETFIAGMLDMSQYLPLARQRSFARCALLRLAQRALDYKPRQSPAMALSGPATDGRRLGICVRLQTRPRRRYRR